MAELLPGEVRVIPTPHGDGGELSKILQRVPELEHLQPVRPSDPQTLVALKVPGKTIKETALLRYSTEVVVPPKSDQAADALAWQGKSDQIIVSRNTIPGQGPWRVTQAIRKEDGSMFMATHDHFPTFELAKKNAESWKWPLVESRDVALQSELVSTTDLARISEDIARQGFARGQQVAYDGGTWFAVGLTEKGDKIRLTQPGRTGKPLVADMARVQFHSTIQTVGMSKSVAPLVNDFIEKFTLWPDQGITKALGDYFKIAGSKLPFVDAQGVERTVHGIIGAQERMDIVDQLTRMQRKALAAEDPALGRVIETLDQEFTRLHDVPHPDGPLAELTAQKGLTYIQEFKDGEWHYLLRNAGAETISPPLKSQKDAITWLHNYGVAPGEIIEANAPLLDNVVAPGGVSSVPAHTAGELSNVGGLTGFRQNPLVNLTAYLMPSAQFFKFTEDRLLKMGIAGTRALPDGTTERFGLHPYTDIFLPWLTKKNDYQREWLAALKGGKLDGGLEVKGLLKIFNPNSTAIRQDKAGLVSDMMHLNPSKWSEFAKVNELNESEIKAGRDLRDYFEVFLKRLLADEKINITAADAIENYFPHYRKLSDAGAKESIYKAFYGREDHLSKPMIKFLSDMQRKGVMTKWDDDPFSVTLKYVRTALYKSHLDEVVTKSINTVNAIEHAPGGIVNKDVMQLKAMLLNSARLFSHGAPEAFQAVDLAFENVLKNLHISVDSGTRDRFINTYLTLNYGAFLGFRPAAVVRNLSQIPLVGYPILGGKYLTYGMTLAARPGVRAELDRVGVTFAGHVAVPGLDMIYADVQAARKGVAGVLSKGRNVLMGTAEVGLKAYNSVDEITRAVIYFGQKRKTIDAWGRYAAQEITEDQFYSKSGMNFFGEAVKGEFNRIRAAQGTERAAEFLGKQAAWDANWIYRLGAGPAMFSHGLGRLAGQYGTWPMWYAAYYAQGMKNLKGIDRAVFAARNLAVHKGIILAGSAAGYNLARWTGLSSFSWFGSNPSVDMFSDLRDMWTGISSEGESLVGRDMALGQMGLEDTGEGGMRMFPEMLGGRIKFRDPTPTHPNPKLEFLTSMVSSWTPGYLAIKDLRKAFAAPDAQASAAAVLGLPLETVGHEWPEVRWK